MADDDLSYRQRAMLDVIAGEVRAGWSVPTIRELGHELDINSTNGVADHLKALVRKGWLERRGRLRARDFRLTNKARRYYGLPVVPLEVNRAAARGWSA